MQQHLDELAAKGKQGEFVVAGLPILSSTSVAEPCREWETMTKPSQNGVGGVRRIVYFAAGWGCVGLGLLGAMLPVLPTTPFLLLASYFFVRTSPRANAWLLRSRLFGPYLRDWQEQGGVRLSVKLTAITVVLATVVVSIISGRVTGAMLAVLMGLAAIGLYVVIRLPLVREPRPERPMLRVAPTEQDEEAA